MFQTSGVGFPACSTQPDGIMRIAGEGEATGVPTTAAPYLGSGLVTVNGQVLSNVVSIAAGRWGLALKRDGSVVSWGGGSGHSMSPPAGLTKVMAIAAGQSFGLAVTTNRNPP
jgi:hypothetical protein